MTEFRVGDRVRLELPFESWVNGRVGEVTELPPGGADLDYRLRVEGEEVFPIYMSYGLVLNSDE